MAKLLQIVETLIRCHVLWRLIWICTVCQLPSYGSPEYNGLSSLNKVCTVYHLVITFYTPANCVCVSGGGGVGDVLFSHCPSVRQILVFAGWVSNKHCLLTFLVFDNCQVVRLSNWLVQTFFFVLFCFYWHSLR